MAAREAPGVKTFQLKRKAGVGFGIALSGGAGQQPAPNQHDQGIYGMVDKIRNLKNHGKKHSLCKTLSIFYNIQIYDRPVTGRTRNIFYSYHSVRFRMLCKQGQPRVDS